MKTATLRFLVTVKVAHAGGKQSTREFVAEDIRQQIEESDPGYVYPDDNEYEVRSWVVSTQ